MPQRPARGAAGRLSAIAFSIGSHDAVIPPRSPIVVPLLRKARALGVTTFDLTSSRFPAIAEEALVQAFPEADREIAVIVPSGDAEPTTGRPETSTRPGPAPSRPTSVGTTLEASLRRLGDRYRVLVEYSSPGPGPGSGSPPPPELRDLRREGRIAEVVLRTSFGEEAPSIPSSGLLSAPLSLLDVRPARAFRALEDPPEGAVIVRDVLAGGVLDGSLLAGPFAIGGPAGHPPSLAELHDRLDPVLRLGFLTRDRSRTLIEAAVGFALQWPWVASAVVPLPPPERVASLLSAARAPGLGTEELIALGVGAREPPSPPVSG